MEKYLLNFFIAVLLLTGAIAGFNWWIDPYAIYQDHKSQKQLIQPLLVMNERVFKTVWLTRSKADVVFLGTSVTDIGIGKDHAVFASKRSINLAAFGQPIDESRHLMELALKNSQSKMFVLGLDFLAFNTLLSPPSDYVEENYRSLRPYSLLLSISALSNSWHVMRHKQPNEGDCCYANGFRIPNTLTHLGGSYRNSFINNERTYLQVKYLPYPECQFSFTRKAGGSSFDDLRAMIKLAHQHHVDFRLFISPSHARQWEVISVAGLSDRWEEWKRELVRMNEEEARQVEARPLPLWDFSGYDSISSEAVPAKDDKKTLMRWYSDSAHYTPALGELIIQRMFTSSTSGLPDRWGTLLNAANVESHLLELRAAQKNYQQTHQQDVGEIEASARAVNQVKHCQNSPR